MMPDEFDWAAHTEAVAADIFGEPNAEMSRPPDDVRFGNHGSVSVNYMTGQWFDFENERGGGIKELIHLYKGIDDRDAAIAYAEECQQNFENGGKRRSNGKDDEPYQQVVEATYPYCDTSGQVAFEVVRFVFKRVDGSYVTDARGKRKKTFSQRRPSGESDQSWLWGLDVGEFMRRAPGGNWTRFNATKFEQYPLTRQRKFFNTAAPCRPLPASRSAQGNRRRANDLHRRGREEGRSHSQLRFSRDLLCRGREQVELRAQRIPAERRRRAAAR